MPYRPGRTVAAVPTSARARCGAFPSPRSVSDCAVTAQHADRPDLPSAGHLVRDEPLDRGVQLVQGPDGPACSSRAQRREPHQSQVPAGPDRGRKDVIIRALGTGGSVDRP